MTIVGALDVHRSQITFKCLDLCLVGSGEGPPLGAPTTPWAAMEAATVLSDTAQPASTRSACTRGEPYVAPDSSKERLTASSMRSRRS